MHDSISSAEAAISLASINKHFETPQTVSSIYVGRCEQLEQLKSMFFGPLRNGQPTGQKRFVICGIGGSGKTRFSSKYAQDTRQDYWGVFWLDGSSEKALRQTVGRIAKTAGVETNTLAVKSWLSQLDRPWFLLIDNANSESINVDTLFPPGDRGHVLITTRRPTLKVHGNVGIQSFQFEEPEALAASNLLLSAADEPQPWEQLTEDFASTITKTLGYLPLALVHAGSIIRNGLSSLQDFLNYFRNSRKRVLRARRSRARLRTQSGFPLEEETDLNVFSTFEGLYGGLAQQRSHGALDAIELLNMFSFLNHENIRFDMLTRAAQNPALERREQRHGQSQKASKPLLRSQTGSKSQDLSKSWSRLFSEWRLNILTYILQDRGPPDLPDVLRDTETQPFDIDRLRRALKKLTDMSLIIHHKLNNSYSIHPLVHVCIRERPEMKTAEQALWCGVAATALAQCILLPPLRMEEADEDLRRDLLPHVDHVHVLQNEVFKQLEESQPRRLLLWNPIRPCTDRKRIYQMARYSLVYMQSGLWDETERLLLNVAEFVIPRLGEEHAVSHRVQLALAETYWQLGRGHDAANLQERVLQVCDRSLGTMADRSLEVADKLGVSRWQQGRFKEALALHTRALNGMTENLGSEHPDALRAVDHLGRIHFR